MCICVYLCVCVIDFPTSNIAILVVDTKEISKNFTVYKCDMVFAVSQRAVDWQTWHGQEVKEGKSARVGMKGLLQWERGGLCPPSLGYSQRQQGDAQGYG